MVKAIIFDFDGVFVETEHDRWKQLKEILPKKYHLKDESFIDMIGVKTSDFLREEFPDMPEDVVRDMTKTRLDTVHDKINSLPVITGAADLVRSVHKKYVLALCTGSPRYVVEKFLKHHGLENSFDLLVTAEDSKSSKPDPEGYLVTLRKLKIKPEDAIIIEDSRAGIIAGHKAACKVFAINNGYNSEYIKDADRIFDSHDEIRKYFEKN